MTPVLTMAKRPIRARYQSHRSAANLPLTANDASTDEPRVEVGLELVEAEVPLSATLAQTYSITM